MPAWGLVALGALALLLIAGGIWGVVKAWGSQKAAGAVDRDDLGELRKANEIEAKAKGKAHDSPKTPAGLDRWLRRGVPGAGGRKPGP